MLFTVYCLDKPGHLQVRLDNRPAHLDYLKAAGAAIRLAGPMLADDGEKPKGSLLIVEFPDRAAAETFAANDPYAKAGLFERVQVSPFRRVLGPEL